MDSKGRLLILELGGIGDVVMALPALSAIVGAPGDTRIKILVVERTASIVEQLRHYRRDLEIEGTDVYGRKDPLEWFRLARRLRREGYERVIDMSAVEGFWAGIRRFIFLKALSAPEIIGRNTGGLGWAYTKSVYEELTSKEHEVERKIKVAKLLGIEVEERRPRFITVPHHRGWAEAFLADLSRGPILGVNPGAYRPSRMWRWERFRCIALWAVRELGMGVVLTGGEGDRELIGRIAEGLPVERVRLAIGLPIPRLAALIERFALFLTNDTGPMHVAAAVDTPVIALFGQTNIWRYRPYMEEGRYVIIKKNSTVCKRRAFAHPMEECRRYLCKGGECMDLIGVEEVKDALRRMVDRVVS